MKTFNVPHEDELTESLEVSPQRLEEGTIRLSFDSGDERLAVIIGEIAQSVYCEWERGGQTVLKMTREGAVDLRAGRFGDRTVIDVDFDTEELAGTVTIQVRPSFSVQDVMLFR